MAASKKYSDFVNDLEASRAAVLSVAAFLQSRGRDVTLPGHFVTPSANERYEYQDAYDLAISQGHQIKQSSRHFDSIDGFGFEMITVDEHYKIEKQIKTPPSGYWIVNKSRTAAIFIPWKTRHLWDTYKAADVDQRGRICSFMRCPKSACKFVKF